MTAEIAILNRSAVALAADSAVTVGDGTGSKVYNTVNKLFTLSKYHPIGVMIYGNADYMSVPWETVIKLYREQLGKRHFDTVAQYANDFIRYIDRKFTFTTQDVKNRVFQLWSAYFEDLNRRVRRVLIEAVRHQTLSQSDVDALFLWVVRQHVADIRKQRTLPQYRSIQASAISRFAAEFRLARDANFRGRKITPRIDHALRQYALLILVKEEFEFGTSGIVIAGFGHTEIFPAMSKALCAGRIFGRMKLFIDEYTAVSSKYDERVYVNAFAQREMVQRFMEGIDRRYSAYIDQSVGQLINRLTTQLVAKYAAGTAAQKTQKAEVAKRVAQKMISDLEARAEAFRHEVFIKPVLDTVSILPKEELAELAGALVNITSLKRKMSLEAETVGGPIDVAVISKGDGFIWIRRKHYFTPELNPFFLQNYLTPRA